MVYRLFLLLSVLSILGCDARTKVLQEKITARVDKIIGEFEVKQKQAELAMQKIGMDIDQLKKARIETKVRLTQIDEKIQTAESKQAEIDKTILRLREYLTQGGEVEISGKNFSEQQVKDMAEKTIAVRKKLSSEIEVLKKSSKQIESVLGSLETREREASNSLERTKLAIDEIKTKTLALTTMQQTAETTGTGSSIDFDSLEKQISDIAGKIDVELAFQEEKAKANATSATSVDEIIGQMSTINDTINEIDSLGITQSK
jgi:chromosome segregation ATPase